MVSPPAGFAIVTSLLFVGIATLANAREQAGFAGRQHVYIGTYTGPKSQGIYRAELDLASGKLSEPQLAAEATNPSFLNIHPNHRFLYAVSREGDKQGGVLAFAIEPRTGKLTQLGKQAACGLAPCHLVVDRSGKCVLTASYGGGTVSALPIHSDGSLGDAATTIEHKDAAGAAAPRASHAHSIFLDADNRIAVAADLGLDELRLYDVVPEEAKLTPHDPPLVTVKQGSGPRHFTFAPSGKFAYSNMERSSTVIGFSYDPERGVLAELQSLSTLPADFKGSNSTAEIQVHPSGKFLYVSNRGHNSIAVFTVDVATGRLTAAGQQSSEGKTPRNFCIDPTGRFLLAANQESNNIVVFGINPETGKLTPNGSSVEVSAPVCIKFVPIPNHAR